MPQGINDFARVAASLPDVTILRAEQNQVTQATYRRGVTRAENMQANTETAKIFLQAVRTHPGYASGGAEVEARLNNKIEKGLPLCADEVRSMVRQLNGSQAKAMGERLELAGILPRGTSTAFAKHVLSTFRSLEGEHALRASVRDFLTRHVIPNNTGELTHFDAALVGQNAPALSEAEQQDIRKALVTYRGASDEASYVKTLVIKSIAEGLLPDAPAHAEFGKGMAGLAETGVTNLFAQANKDEIRLLASLPPETRATVLNNFDLLRTLVDAQGRLTLDEQVNFVRYVDVNRLSLDTPTDQISVMRDFVLIEAGEHMAEPLPYGLPTHLERPLAFNPEVKRNAIAMLKESHGPDVVPTREQANAALIQARNEFAMAHAPLINEFLQMAQDPPAGLNLDPPLTPQILPQYLNALLSGDAILEPLFNDSRPVDADYLRSVLRYNEDLESSGDVSGKAMGIDDANKLHEAVTLLHMARRGVGETEYPAMLERGIARFGRAVSELNTLSEQCFTQGNDKAQRDVLSIRRVLSGTMVNVAEQLTPANRTSLGLPADNAAMMGMLFSPFDSDVPVNEFSDQMHDFWTSQGVQLPPTNSAVAKSAMDRQLLEANDKIVNSTLVRILGEATQMHATTIPFSEMVSDLKADLHLNNLDIALLEPKIFQENASRLLHEMAAEAAGHNTSLDGETIRNALRQSIAMDMQGLHSFIAEIDALPKPSHLSEEQHAEQKRIMKEMVQLHPITDLGVLSRLMDKAAGESSAINKLCAPQGTPFAVTSAVSTMANGYAELAKAIGQEAMPPQHIALPCFLDMALRANKMNATSAAFMLENTTGEIAKRVAASFKYVLDSDNCTAQEKVKPQLVRSLMTHLATVSTVLAKGTAEHNPLRFHEGAKHLSEIPTGCLSTIVPSNTPMQEQLNLFGSRLSTAEWDLLERTGNALARNMTQDKPRLASILVNNASSILNAARAAGGKALTIDQIATAVLGSRLTSREKKNGTTDGNRLCNAFVSRYTKHVTDLVDNVSSTTIDRALRMGMANGLSGPVLNDLAHPDGKLTLDNTPPEALELGSLGNYTKDNAFGLREDFPRLHGGTITFHDANKTQHVYSPKGLPKEAIPANNPVFQSIIDTVRGMTSSEAQMLRVMHIFTQAGRKCVGMSSQAFPLSTERSGAVPAMHYSVAGVADKGIMVTMESLAGNPLHMKQQILVHEDGSYAIKDFLIERRHVEVANPAQPQN